MKFRHQPLRALILAMVVLAGSFVFYATGCFHTASVRQDDDVAMAVEWNQFILRSETNCEGYRGPIASRAYAYIGLAAYEAALPGLAGSFNSLIERFPGINLPEPPPALGYDRSIALNACYAAILRRFYLVAPEEIRMENNRLEEKWEQRLSKHIDDSIIKSSKAFGQSVAEAVYTWSATDSLGFEANHHNYERSYIPPVGEGKWVPSTDFPMPPLLPYWGQVRPFVIQTERYLAKPLPPYSTETNQPYYRQAVELISLSSPLSPENQWIADFWNDDHPGTMFTPPGHWLSITNQVVAHEHPNIEKVMETYLKVGFALCDASIATWYSKYLYNLERPETFIQRNIDKSWRPYSPSPSFPSYPSGHACISAAAAEVLTSLYGHAYHMMDCSHVDKENVVLKPREFKSFEQMAKESALSRIFMGVHWRMDAEEGYRIGSLIGQEVSKLDLETKLTK